MQSRQYILHSLLCAVAWSLHWPKKLVCNRGRSHSGHLLSSSSFPPPPPQSWSVVKPPFIENIKIKIKISSIKKKNLKNQTKHTVNKNRDRETIRRKNTISDDYDRIQQEEMTNHELFYRLSRRNLNWRPAKRRKKKCYEQLQEKRREWGMLMLLLLLLLRSCLSSSPSSFDFLFSFLLAFLLLVGLLLPKKSLLTEPASEPTPKPNHHWD